MIKLSIAIFLTSSLFGNTINDIIINNAAKIAYKSEYLIAGNNRAFAQSPGGAWSWDAGKETIESARESALKRCNLHLSQDDKPCKIIEENGKWVK
ncbi:MAG: hypothetical protein M0P91_05820 [Sulfuricurvum sp.]|jgi:hypothetical protein|uniref:hypothetical protein n=1 Tax=Sulfuricurvum sp. TaxID=2025608 RepID=UPI0025FB30B3|nr:hypothetical protein [Sulfuricurvum sp.]MCK9372696.1 hypothetical protein [Sulfuricurvum sp.]